LEELKSELNQYQQALEKAELAAQNHEKKIGSRRVSKKGYCCLRHYTRICKIKLKIAKIEEEIAKEVYHDTSVKKVESIYPGGKP